MRILIMYVTLAAFAIPACALAQGAAPAGANDQGMAGMKMPMTMPMSMPGMDMSSPGATRTMVSHSEPTEGATVVGSPPKLTIAFVHPMTLQSVVLTDAAGHSTPVTAQPEQMSPDTASIALPPLQPGNYTANWTGLGVRTPPTKMTGGVHFTVK